MEGYRDCPLFGRHLDLEELDLMDHLLHTQFTGITGRAGVLYWTERSFA